MVTDKINCNVAACLNWRYATKKFDPTRKIDPVLWNQIEQALILTPSSFGLQPWKFLVITDQSIKDQLPAISWNQKQPQDCSHHVVICRLKELTVEYVHRYAEHTASTRGVPVKTVGDFTKMMLGFVESNTKEALNEWMEKQCYIALGNLLTTAAVLGVDNCPMEGLNREAYNKFFGLDEKGCHATVMCALGYRADDDKYGSLAKVRFPASQIIISV
jgi:nitroreductase